MVTAYIGLGSNLGNRKNNISKALQNLARLPHTTLLKTSSLYNSSAIGPVQRDFVNCIARIATSQSPPRLLDNLNEIERRMGRRKNKRWGPRLIDLDIIFYGRNIVSGRRLVVPHREAARRRFVIEPMSEMSPGFVHPVLHITMRTIRNRLRLTAKVQKVTMIPWKK
ncbi:MAG: 2-amino-4-hydroxy-6-hydroxymethyldihydropteridine diphosphokinase [Elusimicrobia bacterium RIFOXYA2_FULL_50_26]|nr:MAG: 2-amino-4-hydroxy-6-hydroxymethyldihydropteridine diphosphokinase [Elusimicrobia bacterium RIFOXYA2_FULL_50_26]